jgi:hypothetical protein
MLLFDMFTSISLDELLYFAFNVTDNIKNCLQMSGWENFNLSHKIEDQIIFFQKINDKEIWTSYNI